MTGPSVDQSAKPQSSGLRHYLIASVVAAAGLAAILLALPRLLAGITEGPFEEAMASISSQHPPSETVIHRVLLAKQRTINIHATAKTLADIGFLQLRNAIQSGPLSDEGKQALDASIDAHRASLAVSPYNSYVWARLGQDLLVKYGADAPMLGTILKTSVMMAPYDSRLVLARVDMALATWDQLYNDEKEIVDQQIHIAADQSPTALARLAQQRFGLSHIVDVLSDNSVLLKRFLYSYTAS